MDLFDLLRDSFTFLYVEDVYTSQETQASTALRGIVLLSYLLLMFVPHRKQATLPVTG
jgi:hypothetical protein